MEQTPNYHLNKPGYEEFGDVEVLNQNFAAIDTELKKNADAVDERVKTTELAEKVKQTVKAWPQRISAPYQLIPRARPTVWQVWTGTAKCPPASCPR